VARNRKRAKERRNRRPNGAVRTERGIATARPQRGEETPAPIEHATPDVELAEAQLALGREQLDNEPDAEPGATEALGAPELEPAEPDEEELYFEAERAGPPDADGSDEPSAGELAATGAGHPERRVRSRARLINFLQGSWRELQRVQWPDRRAVMQATGVVIGFVIIAGLYLGLADQVASKIVTLILK
jgi:preprotein translocase subunit SecE